MTHGKIEESVDRPILTGREAADYLGVSPNVITRLANNGDLSYSILGSRKVYQREKLNSYLKTHNLVPAPSNHSRISSDIPEIVGLSFFSGAGGLDLGMERAGIPALLFCENNRECRMTLSENRPDTALLGDISSITAEEILRMAKIKPDRDVDVMFGGPPCQAFSTAGARRAFNDVRGNVFLRYLDLAAEIRPKYLVIENVRGLLSTPFPVSDGKGAIRGGAMQVILNKLKDMGYGVSFNLYNAANFGAAQIRERVVLIAKRDGSKAHWLQPTHSNDPRWGLPQWRTLKNAILPIEKEEQHYATFPKKRLRFFKLLKEGQCWTSLPKNLQPEAMGKAFLLGGGKTGFYRRLAWNKPSPTLVTSPTMPATDLCHPQEDRPLSIEEYKAIQGFPADWRIAGDISDIYREIGNAVPVQLGQAIGEAILSDMKGIGVSDKWEEFPYSRYNKTSDKTWSLA